LYLAIYNKANALSYLEEYEKAIECYNRVLELNPLDTNAINNLGASLVHLARDEEAIECFTKLIELNPKDADGLFIQFFFIFIFIKRLVNSFFFLTISLQQQRNQSL